MRVSTLLSDDSIVTGLEADSLQSAVQTLLERLEDRGELQPGRAKVLASRFTAGEVGELVRVSDDVVLVLLRAESAGDLSLLLGITASPLLLEPGEAGSSGVARILGVLVTPRRIATLKAQAVPALTRILRDGERAELLLAAREPSDIRGMEALMTTELHEKLLVEDLLTPVSYRIYPDTPLTEVVDLMIRKGLEAVPVVGEKYEVLGIITASDALRHLLPRTRSGEMGGDDESRAPLMARDVMTRSVLCVSEDQSLMEVANLMANKDVEQFPVVREGELIGFVTRAVVLSSLFTRHQAGRDRTSEHEQR